MNLKIVRDMATYLKRELDPRFVNDVARIQWQNLWTNYPWSWRHVWGQITAVADYTTGGILTLTQADTAVTGTGTSWPLAVLGRHLRPNNASGGSGDVRDYHINSYTSGTAIGIENPYEGSSISASTTYTIRQRWYRLPPAFDALHVSKSSTGPIIVAYLTRREFEELMPQANQQGNTYWLVEAGVSTFVLYNTGSVTMTENSTTVTGSGTAWTTAAHAGRRFRVAGYGPEVGDFTITAVSGVTTLTIDRAWPKPTKSVQSYEIDPIGEPLVEMWPAPNANTSVGMWYYKKPPPLARDTEFPEGLPIEYGNVWLAMTLEALGIKPPEPSEVGLGRLMARDGLDRKHLIPAPPYGWDYRYGRSLLPYNYPATLAGRRRF